MPSISRLYDFQAGTVIQSGQVDGEFNQLISTVNALPDKDGTLQTNLNADQVDSFHASATGGDQTIPICDADVLQVDLNADLLDGQHASDIAASAFDVGTKMLFYNSSPPGGWSVVTAPTDHVLRWKSGATGGTTEANTWVHSGYTITCDNHGLTVAEMPPHTHTMGNHTHTMGNHTHEGASHEHGIAHNLFNAAAGGTSVLASVIAGTGGTDTETVSPGTSSAPSTNTTSGPSTNATGSQGAGASHNHGMTYNHDGTWRPPTAYFIVANKD